MAKKKFYVVWEGRKTGILESWKECTESIHGFKGAKYKSFKTLELAKKAFSEEYDDYKGKTFFEIGYSILPKFWGMGYASEASQKCRDFAFENNFSDYLISMINIENIGSQKVALRNGMKLERETISKGDAVYIFGIHKSDWESK